MAKRGKKSRKLRKLHVKSGAPKCPRTSTGRLKKTTRPCVV
jgi:hypothetical protein